MASILEDVKVLDLTRVIAGPLCTQILADMGATVYKIEARRGRRHAAHGLLPARRGDGHKQQRRRCACGLQPGQALRHSGHLHAEGAALARQLASRCDVLVEA